MVGLPPAAEEREVPRRGPPVLSKPTKPRRSLPEPGPPEPSIPSARICVIIPYLGENLPPYFNLFKFGASGSAGLVDFLIFHASSSNIKEQQTASHPRNVKFIDLKTIDKFAELHARVVTQSQDNEPIKIKGGEGSLVSKLTKQLKEYPYHLVQFKPAYGHIFNEYIKDYSHWGYADLDMVFGDLKSWISTDELNDFDVVTYSMGDQERVYLRGQFTFHKNTPKVNNIWRDCKYLSELSGQRYHFESAEGCYSRAVLRRDDVNAKYVVKAMADVDGEDGANGHGVMLASTSDKRLVLYKAGTADGTGERFRSLNPKNLYLGNETALLHWEVGEMQPVVTYKDTPDLKLPKNGYGCMMWAPQQYQKDLCAHDVDASYTLKLIGGKLYKQKYEKVSKVCRLQLPLFVHESSTERVP